METYTFNGNGRQFIVPIDASKRTINSAFRAIDESHKWPIYGRFNASERAIRRLRRIGAPFEGLEYIYALETEIRYIVNREI